VRERSEQQVILPINKTQAHKKQAVKYFLQKWRSVTHRNRAYYESDFKGMPKYEEFQFKMRYPPCIFDTFCNMKTKVFMKNETCCLLSCPNLLSNETHLHLAFVRYSEISETLSLHMTSSFRSEFFSCFHF